jgi:hypothetical protein
MLDNDPRVPIIPAMLVLTAATGGATTGPTSTKAQRHDYNAALQQTNDKQMLMSIVRLRYGSRWFCSSDTDSRSKATLLLLTQLHALQSAPPTTGGPSLVLPVRGR